MDPESLFRGLQRLLTEGSFSSTYKYALLIALARWALEHPDHEEGVPLDVGELAEGFLELYWPQVRPFGGWAPAAHVAEAALPYGNRVSANVGNVLEQDPGQRPRVVRLILEERAAGAQGIRDLAPDRRARLLREVRTSIRDMPLWRLQNLRGERDVQFLYRQGANRSQIVFEPGVVACLSAFAPLIEQMVRAAWLNFVVRVNPSLVGASAAQLEGFMFPDGRGDLSVWRAPLMEIQGDRCFYCSRTMSEFEVDHFLPWSLYPRDLGQNFVLAHRRCNGEKSDYLAAGEHLQKWCERNEGSADDLRCVFERDRLPQDLVAVRGAARSLYSIASAAEDPVWLAPGRTVRLDERWKALLAAS